MERALALMEKHDHELDGLDVEALLNYAEFMAENPARLWQEPVQSRSAGFRPSWFQLG